MLRQSLKLQLISGIILLAGLFSVLMMQNKPLGDYGNYYYGARIAVSGENVLSEVYDSRSFNTHVQEAGERNFFLNHCTVTPQTILFYVPFALISGAILSKSVFGIFSLFVFVFAFIRFASRYFPDPHWRTYLLTIAGLLTVHYNIQLGQSWLLVTALIMFAFLKSEESPVLSGLCFAMAILLKLSPAFLLLILVSRRQWKPVLATASFIALFTLVFGLLFNFGFEALNEFYSHSLMRISGGYFSDPYSSSFQSFIVLLRKLMVHDDVLNTTSWWSGSERTAQFINIIFTGILMFLIAGSWNQKTGLFARVRILLLFLLLTSGYTSSYSFVIILPFLFSKEYALSLLKIGLYTIVFVAPPRLFDGTNPFLEEYKMWVMLALFIAETVPAFSFRVIRLEQAVVAATLLIFFCLKSLNNPETLQMTYFKPDAINSDYVTGAYIRNDSLNYMINENGTFKLKKLVMKPAFNGAEWISRNNEAYKLNHVNVILIAERNDELLVLSDYRRGPGLFHLYSLPKTYFIRLKSE